MYSLSATDIAIAEASQSGGLKMVERVGRLGDRYVAISDARGVIEIASSWSEADRRVAFAVYGKEIQRVVLNKCPRGRIDWRQS